MIVSFFDCVVFYVSVCYEYDDSIWLSSCCMLTSSCVVCDVYWLVGVVWRAQWGG